MVYLNFHIIIVEFLKDIVSCQKYMQNTRVKTRNGRKVSRKKKGATKRKDYTNKSGVMLAAFLMTGDQYGEK